MADGKVTIEAEVDGSEVKSGVKKIKDDINNGLKDAGKQPGQKMKDDIKKPLEEGGKEGTSKVKEHLKKLGDGAGKLIQTAGKAVAAGVTAAGAGVIKLAKDSVAAYGEYQQMVGGVQKLYGNMGLGLEEYAASVNRSTSEVEGEWQKLQTAQDIVINNAKEAYKTAGMDMNTYMNTATSFSAALITSLNGDTVEAAKLTDVAMRAISDNWNTFGGDIGRITDAYQGFAKQNYTMLDNLKLGYGGTKHEMERLIQDANEYAKSIGQAGDMSIESFADIVKAIELIQEKQGVAGTTAREAQSTLQGSLQMTKSAWQNLLIVMGDPEGKVDEAINNLLTSADALMQNFIPIVEKSLDGISKVIDDLAPVIADKLPGLVETLLPHVIEAAGKIVNSLIQNLPQILSSVWTAISQDAETSIEGVGVLIAAKWPQVFIKAFTGIGQFAGGLFKTGFQAIPWEDVGSAILTGVQSLGSKIGTGLSTALEVVGPKLAELGPKIASGLETAIGVIGPKLSSIGPMVITAFGEMATFLGGVASTLGPVMTALWTAITGPVGIVIAIIGAVIGVFVLLYNTFEPFRNFVDTFVQGMQQIFSGDFEGAAETFRGLWQGVADFWVGVWQGILDFFSGVVDGIISFFQGIVDFVLNNWQAILGFIANPIIGAFMLLYNNCEEFRNFIDNLVNSIIEFFMRLPENIMNIFNSIVSFIGELPGKISSALMGVIFAIGAWAGQLWSSGIEAAGRLVSAVVDTITSLPGKLVGIGRNIVEGLWNGINDMVGWIIGKIQGFGENILKGIQAFFGIGSPSKLMRDKIGKWLPPGIVIGWEKGWEESNLMGRIKDDIDAGISKIKTMVSVNADDFRFDFADRDEQRFQKMDDIKEGPTLNFYDVQTSPDSIYQKFHQSQTYGLARSY